MVLPKLPTVTNGMRESARRRAESTKLPYEVVEHMAQAAVKTANIASARKSKEKAFAAGDLDAYRAWMIKEARFMAGFSQQELADLIWCRLVRD